MQTRKSWFLLLRDNSKYYIGECAPLPQLSLDDIPKIPEVLINICDYFNVHQCFPSLDLNNFPSIAFAIESIQLQLKHQQPHLLFPSDFTFGKAGISLNGLIWVGEKDWVIKQIENKIAEGFPCIKMKVGALPFEDELKLLSYVRKRYPDMELRLDANGAFSPEEALFKIEKLAKFNIHSLEQPIAAGQWEALRKICLNSPIPIALDEELIPLKTIHERNSLIQFVMPSIIILKPSLLGGFSECESWINLAIENKINWWITSALESSVGLNAIAQWTNIRAPEKVHGLGTGKIYKNNIPSPLYLSKGKLFLHPEKHWNISEIIQNDA